MEEEFFKLVKRDRRNGQDRRSGGTSSSSSDQSSHSRFREESDEDSSCEERGVIDWLDEEAREERRNGKERRSGTERRGSVLNRLDERRVIPFSVAPRGEIRASDGQHWHCTLWDVSLRGLCVVSNASFEPPLGSELQLALYEVVGLGSMFFKAKLRWLASDDMQTYLGLQFCDPEILPEGTFLERYLQANFDT